VAVDTLTRLGLPMKGVRMLDGSGLAPGNRVTCRLLAAILNGSPSRTTVERALPVAARSGTLSKRFLATAVAGRLRAKTGSIRDVASLAGYADGPNRRTLTFAFVQNGVGFKQGLQLQDELGRSLVLTTL
jgi:D-alanyl-D-alanine carboxypeptidase/D-alanyl-D-alanine-endopeptidase (penicillin-binding protein 4)